MGREINEDRIRDLDKKIEEDGAEDTLQLKRTRNSLLNISTRTPPEILGYIFRWRVTPDEDLPYPCGLPKNSYAFRLVCHHWFEVAAHTPELWGYWGNTLERWLRFYKLSGTTPVDLALNGLDRSGNSNISFDGPLRDALRERAELGAIRSIRLRWNQKELPLDSILSALTPDGKGVRRSSIEFITLRYVDASEFLTRHSFPKLRQLHISTMDKFLLWEHLGQHTTALTDLFLSLDDKASCPTTTQLLSILASNPRLQILALFKWAIPRDSQSMVPVPLRYLERLSIDAEIRPVFQLLSQLEYPDRMKWMNLTVSDCVAEDIPGTIGPYVCDHIQRDGRFQESFEISINSSNAVSIETSTTNDSDATQRLTFAAFTAIMQEDEDLPLYNKAQMCADLVAHIPAEHVVYLESDLDMDSVKRAVLTMPKIKELRLFWPKLQNGFLQPDPRDPLAKKLLPSLQCLCLEDVVLENGGWSHLLRYLTHQTSDGQQISLRIYGGHEHICKGVLKETERLTEEIVFDLTLVRECPYCKD